MIEMIAAVDIFTALAHEKRLAAFQILVRVGPAGLAAGRLAKELGLGATAASFHLSRMLQSGLVTRRRSGAQLIYSANFDLMNELRGFLDAQCCADLPTGCSAGCPYPNETKQSPPKADPAITKD